MNPVQYFLAGLVVMSFKFACALIVASRSGGAKERLKANWGAWEFLTGILFWPIELLHLLYVLLDALLTSALESA